MKRIREAVLSDYRADTKAFVKTNVTQGELQQRHAAGDMYAGVMPSMDLSGPLYPGMAEMMGDMVEEIWEDEDEFGEDEDEF